MVAIRDVDGEQRRIYRSEGQGYPSELRDVEWAWLEPLIPKASPGWRPHKTASHPTWSFALQPDPRLSGAAAEITLDEVEG